MGWLENLVHCGGPESANSGSQDSSNTYTSEGWSINTHDAIPYLEPDSDWLVLTELAKPKKPPDLRYPRDVASSGQQLEQQHPMHWTDFQEHHDFFSVPSEAAAGLPTTGLPEGVSRKSHEALDGSACSVGLLDFSGPTPAHRFNGWDCLNEAATLEQSGQAYDLLLNWTMIAQSPCEASTSASQGTSTPHIRFSVPCSEGSQSESPSHDLSAAGEVWHCDYDGCLRSFSHRYKLNRHKQYHTKPYRCEEDSCITTMVAFALSKDLVRHQARHSGRRLYCLHESCPHAISGTQNGFTRRDNLQRHMRRKHS